MNLTATPPPDFASSPEFEEILIRADRAAVVATLARGMAHDLRTPLQTLTLLLDPHAHLLGGFGGDRLRGAGETALEQLGETIARFGEIYAPAESEPMPLIVSDLLEQVADLQRYQRGLPSAELDVRVPSGFPPLRGIEAPLRHLLLDLIVNSKQAFQERSDGKITLAAILVDGRIQLSVSDNGPGISAETWPRVFQPFFTTRPGNLGIGLAVARWLAVRQGGGLTLAPNEGGGVRAAVELAAWTRVKLNDE